MAEVLNCPYCPIEDDENQIIRFSNELVLFTEAPKYQRALKYSGIIIPKAHRETVFNLTPKASGLTLNRMKIGGKYEGTPFHLQRF